jgi:hypothetical protein
MGRDALVQIFRESIWHINIALRGSHHCIPVTVQQLLAMHVGFAA